MNERRGSGRRDTGERRRREDLSALRARLEDAENRLDILDGDGGLLDQMIAMKSQIQTILDMTQMYLPTISQKANKATSFWTIVAALTAIIVPIIVVLIAGYFTLKSAIPTIPPPKP